MNPNHFGPGAKGGQFAPTSGSGSTSSRSASLTPRGKVSQEKKDAILAKARADLAKSLDKRAALTPSTNARSKTSAAEDGIPISLQGVHPETERQVRAQLRVLAAKYPKVAATVVVKMLSQRDADLMPTLVAGTSIGIGQSKSEIMLHPRFFSRSPKEFAHGTQDWTAVGTPAGTITHEFGHAVENWLLMHQPKTHGEFQRQTARLPAPSPYGRTSLTEKFAEGFAVAHHKSPSEIDKYSRRVAEYVEVAHAHHRSRAQGRAGRAG